MRTTPHKPAPSALRREPVFTRACYGGGRPRAFVGVIRDWPASSRWTPAYLRDATPDFPVQVAVEGPDGGPVDMVEEGFHRYLDYYGAGDFTERRHLREVELLRHAPDLAADARFADFARRRDMLDHRVSFGLPSARGRLHFDYFDSFICAMRGRTELITMPQAMIDRAYMSDEADIFLKRSQADAFEPDLDRFPRMAEALAAGSSCTLEPGDIVYLPAGCLHQIRALEPTLTLITTTINPRRALTVLPRELIKATLHGMGLYKAS